MSVETLFSVCNALVLPGWLLLLLVPRWQWTLRLAGVVLPLLLAVIYLYLILRHFGASAGGFGSLAEVTRLFQNPPILLAGWLHYLAFDLFVGCWEVRDAQRLGVPHLAVMPCLILTFLFGPIGLLGYLALRFAVRRTMTVE